MTKKATAKKSDSVKHPPNEMTKRAVEQVRQLLKTERFSGWGGQAKIGAAIGRSGTMITKMLNGRVGVSPDTARAIAELAGSKPYMPDVDGVPSLPNTSGMVPAFTSPRTVPPPNKTVQSMPAVHRLEGLEIAIAYHGQKWSAPTVAAARLIDGHDRQPHEWATVLDRLEKAINQAIGG